MKFEKKWGSGPHVKPSLRFLRLIGPSALVLTSIGCGSGSSPITTELQGGETFHGRVLSGLQPVSGASVSLYAAGSSSDGSGATNLLSQSFTTDATGAFTLTGLTCPTSTTQVYLVARGGDPNLAAGTNNTALVLLSAVGNCSGITSTSSIILDEATTVAAAWSLSQFLGPGAIIGATATNATGLRNAIEAANNLVNTSTGLASGSTLPQGAKMEATKLNTLANALVSCAGSTGTTACNPLFSAATVSGTAPSNTLDAAWNIVRNPSANVEAVYSAALSSGPFQPTLAVHPNDWTMSVTYGNCTSGCGGLNLPGYLAIDSTGNIWVANYSGAVVSEFSTIGVPAAANGFAGEGLNQSIGIAIDAQNNVWVANENSVTGANNSHHGSVSKFSSSGSEVSAYGYTVGGLDYPMGLAADSNGTIWAADYASSAATLLASDGSAISGSSGYGTSAVPFPSDVAIDANHNAWISAQGAVVRVTPAGVISSFACCSSDPAGIAVDQVGNVWFADAGASSVVELTSSGTVAHRILLGSGADNPQGIAVDGASNIWTANYFGNSVTEIAGSTTTILSPSLGYGLDAPLHEPYGLGVDASGNLWLSNYGSSTLTEFIGVASPIATPLLGPPARP